MFWFSWWQLVWALAGAFGTAWLHQYTGRDPRIGGVLGLLIGFLFGPFALVSFWVWLYYTRSSVVVLTRTRRWYEWWRP
jgi:hypothetical protein